MKHMKMGMQPAPKMSCISNIPHTMESVQHKSGITNLPLSQTFRESLDLPVPL